MKLKDILSEADTSKFNSQILSAKDFLDMFNGKYGRGALTDADTFTGHGDFIRMSFMVDQYASSINDFFSEYIFKNINNKNHKRFILMKANLKNAIKQFEKTEKLQSKTSVKIVIEKLKEQLKKDINSYKSGSLNLDDFIKFV